MSVMRLLISGLLVASGLILAAFTLHGAFDGWQLQTAGASGPALSPWSTNTLKAGDRRVSTSADAPESGQSRAQPSKTGAKADAKASGKRKRTEKRPAAQPPKQQAASQWPWSGWLGN